MSKRIFSLVMCIVIALSLLGVGCDDKKEDAMADNSSLDEIYSSEVSSLNNAINDSSSKESSKDEYAFENAPEGEEYDFGDNGLGAYFPSFGESSSGNQNASNDDIFNIEDIPSFNATPSNKPSNTSSNNTSSTRKPTNPLYIDKTLSFSPLTATHDGLLDNNPDRGYRTEMVLYIKHKESEKDDPRTAYVNESKAEIRRRVEKVFDIYFKKNYSTNKTFLAYIYITDFRNDSISNAAPVLEMFFQICREKKVKSMLRFCYNNSYAKNFELSQENKDKLASECADQKTILRHIDELAPYIKKYSDTIHTISCGFIGFVGEWAYHYQYPIVDYPTVMKAIVEKLCVPNGLYFSIRHPEYKSRLGSSYKYNNYISYNNDAMYGEQRNYNWNSGNYQIGTDGWWEKVTNVAAYTPQDGEMYTNDVLIDRYNMVPKGLDVILECAHHRHTSMSNWHGYLEALHRDNIITRWKNNETVTTSWLKSKKIIYD
ncbi:MAG: DUF4874 domain-containing protein, partial [Clostridia bacterium]|nr:DUF4874 domain-containing protein [Clostridia bacterium]